MPDGRFYKKNGIYKLGFLAEISGSRLHNPTQAELIISDIAPLDMAKRGEISFLQNPKYIQGFKNTKASACIIAEKNLHHAPENIALLISNDPYYSFAKISQQFYLHEQKFLEISENAIIDPAAEIGDRTVIHPTAYIGKGVQIGKNCAIHANVSITHAIIGDNVIIHHGAAIGQDGFGYAFYNGKHHKIPQLGRVIIENDVEIGANTTIDRGAGPDTIVGEGTKIDNLVQIAHNVRIGKHCIIVAQVGISGSTEIGDYSVIGGQVGIIGHLKIGKGVQIAAQSGIFRNLEDKEIVGGSPCVPLRQHHKQTIFLEKSVTKKGLKNEND